MTRPSDVHTALWWAQANDPIKASTSCTYCTLTCKTPRGRVFVTAVRETASDDLRQPKTVPRCPTVVLVNAVRGVGHSLVPNCS